MRKLKFSLVFTALFITLMLSVSASAKTGFYGSGTTMTYYNKYGNKVVGTWFKDGSSTYYAKKNTGYIAVGLTTINNKIYYFNSKGKNLTGWQTINGKKYYFMKKTREAITGKIYTFSSGKAYAFNPSGQRVTGKIKYNNKFYYFKPDMQTGWQTIDGDSFYFYKSGTKKGQAASGLVNLSGKYYYFKKATSILLTDSVITVNGTKYSINAKGICTPVEEESTTPTTVTNSDKMLFFLTFESGSERYNQTGGDNGNACGAYQFDYRYSLLDFIKYAYSKDSKLCAEFKAYTTKSKSSLKSNKKLYKAWNKIYKRNPTKFSKLQDDFAKQEYYSPVEKSLKTTYNIDISTRSDAVKGAVYSYSIQHGPGTAAKAVNAIKVTKTMTDKTFLKRLYGYRIKAFPAYKTRYTAEYQKALEVLNQK